MTDKERLEDIKERLNCTLVSFGRSNGKTLFSDDIDWLIQQAERVEELKKRCTEIAAESTAQEEKLLKEKQWLEKRVEELENRNKELEYASEYNGELNEFLQKRKLPPSTLGRHVVDVVMNYVEDLEKGNERYRRALEEIRNEASSYMGNSAAQRLYDIAIKALEQENDLPKR